MNIFKKYPKDCLWAATAIVVGFVSVMGGHLADAATNKAAWSFWAVAQVVCVVAIVGAWVYAWTKQPKRDQK